jgi:hypothetical protein
MLDGASWQCPGTVPTNVTGRGPLQLSISADAAYVPIENPDGALKRIDGDGTVAVSSKKHHRS